MPSHDPARRRRAVRSGRETGCWVYIDSESLLKAGHRPGGVLPWYRVNGAQRSRNAGSAIVSLYREP